jgi:hypothetical protein
VTNFTDHWVSQRHHEPDDDDNRRYGRLIFTAESGGNLTGVQACMRLIGCAQPEIVFRFMLTRHMDYLLDTQWSILVGLCL